MTASTSSSAARTDVREWITIRGARQNNLRGMDVQLPKNRIITVLGRSGAGKSSLVMDTIAAEAQRRLNATYPAFIQSLMGALPRPAVDSITGLGAAIVVDQAPIGTSARSTVGTFSETGTMLRALYHAEGSPPVRSVAELSFNDPEGMCPNYQGSGRATRVDLDLIVDRSKSLSDGAIMFPNFAVGSLFWTVYANSGVVDPDTAVQDYSEDQLRILLYGTKATCRRSTRAATTSRMRVCW